MAWAVGIPGVKEWRWILTNWYTPREYPHHSLSYAGPFWTVGGGEWPLEDAEPIPGTTISWRSFIMQPSFLSLLCEEVRLALDDPTVGAKFTDTQIVRLASTAARQVLRDLCAVTARPVVLHHKIAINTTDTVYYLPAAIGEVIRIGEYDEKEAAWKWVLRPPSRWSVRYRTIRIEGRRVKLEAPANSAFTLTIEYIPSTEFYPHEAVHQSLVLAGAPALKGNEFPLIQPSNEVNFLVRGHVDDRPGAYTGSLLRVWRLWPNATQPSIRQERLIVAHTISDQTSGWRRMVTVDVAFDPPLVAEEGVAYQYEIVPMNWDSTRQVIMLRTAMTLAQMADRPEKAAGLLAEYRAAIRSERLAEAYFTPYEQTWAGDSEEGEESGML